MSTKYGAAPADSADRRKVRSKQDYVSRPHGQTAVGQRVEFQIEPLEVQDSEKKLSANALSILNTRKAYQVTNKSTVDIAATSVDEISFANVDLLKKFLTISGKILPRRSVTIRTKQDKLMYRKITESIKIARILGLLPFNGQKPAN